VRRVLPRRLAARLDALLRTVGFTAPERADAAPETDVLLLIAEAAGERRAVTIGYRAADGSRSERTLHPYAVVAHHGRWYVTGADSASGQERTFRVDRIHTAALLPETFAAPENHDPAVRLLTALAEAPRRHAVSVLIQAAPGHVDLRVPPGLGAVEPITVDGRPWVRPRRQVEELGWVPSLLAWIDRPFRIEEPVELRDHVRALAGRLADSARS
jgi:predicted DNA-binding transcriptional regulator YafY